MKSKVLSIVLLIHLGFASAQEFQIDASYTYLYSKQWDKAIQTYNVSRPWLTEKQPLLIHGFNGSLSYIFNSVEAVNHGINLSYTFVRSSAANDNIENNLYLHFLTVGYLFHYQRNEKLRGIYTDLVVSAKFSGLYRTINGEPFVYSETYSNAFGIGGDIRLKLGYYIPLKNTMYLSPFISSACTPYLYSPNSEAVINQTKGLTSNPWTALLTNQIGLTFHLK